MSTTATTERDTDTGSTPLDVLLTAISGSTINYPYPAASLSPPNIAPSRVSTVQLWYPTTAQKSYGKERRMLNPPPTLRVQGPLHDTLTSVTLVAKNSALSSSTSPGVSSSQTHRIPLQSASDDNSDPQPPSKKAKRHSAKRKLLESAAEAGLGASLPWHLHRKIARARGALADGLSFPGLWAGEGLGKSKQFELELQIGQPGQDSPEEPAGASGTVQPAEEAEVQSEQTPDISQAGIEEPPPSAPDSPFPPGLTAADLEDIGRSSSDFMTTFEQHLNHSALVHPQEHESAADNLERHVEGHDVDPFVKDAEDQATAKSEVSQTLAEPNAPRRAHRSLAYKHIPRTVENPSPWATFTSSPLTIVSKPSIKTAKARSMTSCLTSKETFALYVRINNQTTRTKYMKLENGDTPRMTSRTGKWSPFRFNVIHREPIANKTDADMERFRQLGSRYDDVLTYGSIVVLVDANTGVRSERLRLTKVERGVAVVDNDAGHPISELHRIGFVRVTSDGPSTSDLGTRQYLSAPGARLGGGETLEPKAEKIASVLLPAPIVELSAAATIPSSSDIELPHTLGDISSVFAEATAAGGSDDGPDKNVMTASPVQPPPSRKRKTPRTALAKAAVAESEDTGLTALSWHTATRGVQEIQEIIARKSVKRMATAETVEDWMCWTIVSVGMSAQSLTLPWLIADSMSYSFFNGASDGIEVPIEPLKSIPRLLLEPKYRPKHNAVDLVVSPPATDSPFDLYLGAQGPLSVSLWKSSASSDMAKSGVEAPAILLDGNRNKLLARHVTSSFPSVIPHVLVAVELPKAADILRIMDVTTSGTQTNQETPSMPTSATSAPSINGALVPDIAQPLVEENAVAQPEAVVNIDPDLDTDVHAAMNDSIPPTPNEPDIDADPFTTAEASALADASSMWDGKLDLEIGSAFDGPDSGLDADPSSLMDVGEVGVGVDKIGAALEALTNVPGGFAETEAALMPTDDTRQAQEQPMPDVGSDTELKLERPTQTDKSARRGLPLYLVRRLDGVGFGLAYSITVEDGSAGGDKEVKIVREW